ncbi:hypothetical protein [Paenibacillus sp. NFR01]|uniref:hypothetical protein n=1 Tax=Paenibacillus sp. NFR01 TaxID=1566279 RepID=UPI0008B75608|nr:hypothetical protein [Paenibacillus sp. NFR01]SET33239.1 hypothetical protein SAMN03159358_1361 [Paenibacillus sp. NFR01]
MAACWRVRRSIILLRKQRAVLLDRLADIRHNLRRVPNPSVARTELLEAKASIKEALRLNAAVIQTLRNIP